MSDATSALRLSLSDLDLLDRDRIVLVHDRHDPEGQQSEQRIARIQIPRAVPDVLRRQQHLTHRDAVSLEGDLVLPHQRGLAHGGGSLLLGNRAGTLGESEPCHAGRDGARGDERDLTVLFAVDVATGELVERHRIGAREFSATPRAGTGELWIHTYHGIHQPGNLLLSWSPQTRRLTSHGRSVLRCRLRSLTRSARKGHRQRRDGRRLHRRSTSDGYQNRV